MNTEIVTNEEVVATEATEVEATAAETTEAPAAREEGARKPFRSGNMNHKKKKVCIFCADKSITIDYKDTRRLVKFTSERGKILPRRVTGACAMHQREITRAIKLARVVALLPYTAD